MGCLNINSISKHPDEIEIYLSDGIFDVLAINETKLDQSVNSSLISITAYTCICNDRNKSGGGVSIYIRNSISYTRKPEFEDGGLEMILIKIQKPNSSPSLVTTWYRPPKSPIELFNNFEEFLIKADSTYKEYYILGDLNCDLLPLNSVPKA